MFEVSVIGYDEAWSYTECQLIPVEISFLTHEELLTRTTAETGIMNKSSPLSLEVTKQLVKSL